LRASAPGKCRYDPHRLRSEGKIAMTLANLLAEGTFVHNTKSFGANLTKIDGKGSITRLGKNEGTGLAMNEAIEPESELFAVAEQVDLAEKTFHDALARRNEAQIAYLREPSIMSRDVRLHYETGTALASRRLTPRRPGTWMFSGIERRSRSARSFGYLGNSGWD
jgi:hypothetical protein